MKTPEQLALQAIGLTTLEGSIGYRSSYEIALRAVHATLADVFEVPEAVAFDLTTGGVFCNEEGDKIVEPLQDQLNYYSELILVRADGTTATHRGVWETGFTARPRKQPPTW